MEKTNIFKCKPPEVHFTIRNRVPYNKLLTNLACSSRTGEYWPSVVFVRTSLRSVRTATTSGQYSSVRPSRSVSKRLVVGHHVQNGPFDLICEVCDKELFCLNWPERLRKAQKAVFRCRMAYSTWFAQFMRKIISLHLASTTAKRPNSRV